MATLTAPLVLFLPGWALVTLFLPRDRLSSEGQFDPALAYIMASGLTLTFIPVGFLVLYLAGLKVGTGFVLSVLGLSVLTVFWCRGSAWWTWRRHPWLWRERLAWLDVPLATLILITLLIVGVRLWVVRGINIGFWGDSYHHTLITQLILDHGGLFQSWEPYAPLRTFTYHFGFHADVAWFQWATGWLTRNSTPRTVVLVGQFLNALAALALYPLTVRLCGGRRWAGVIAVLTAGLLTPMPMVYVNWGRYPQLAGQAILPLAIWLTMEAVEAHRWDWRRIALAIGAAAGLVLTHYRVAVFYGAFLIPYLLHRLWAARKMRASWSSPFLRLASIGLPSLALTLPWLLNLWEGRYPAIAAGFIEQRVSSSWMAEYNAVGSLQSYLPWPILGLAGLGGLWSLGRRRLGALVVLWIGVTVILINPHLVGLPGTGLITNFAGAIALYLPASILIGALLGEGVAWPAQRTRLIHYGLGAVVLVIGFWGARQRADCLEPGYQLVAPADEQAMSWIRENTPSNARFLVNAFFAYGDSLVVGSDAGWWIPLLTGRSTTLPPLNYGSEASAEPDYWSQVNELVRRLQDSPLDDPATVQLLKENGVTHVYLGEKGGPLLKLEEMQRNPGYRPVYHHSQIWIFELVPAQE